VRDAEKSRGAGPCVAVEARGAGPGASPGAAVGVAGTSAGRYVCAGMV
jgi:hypothetical protein